MKYIFYIPIFLISFAAQGQAKDQRTSQAAAYYQMAINRYTRCVGNKDSMILVYSLLERAIKENRNYFNAYSEIVAFHCQMDEYQAALKAILRMTKVFQSDIQVNLLCGALEYKTGHAGEAAVYYNKVIKLCDGISEKLRKGDAYNNELCNKGLALILLGRTREGTAILKNLYNNENSDVIKSRLAYYLNCKDKDGVLNEVIPGKWN